MIRFQHAPRPALGAIAALYATSPLARDYYAHLGWEPITTGWKLRREDPLPSYEDFRAEFAHLAEKTCAGSPQVVQDRLVGGLH